MQSTNKIRRRSDWRYISFIHKVSMSRVYILFSILAFLIFSSCREDRFEEPDFFIEGMQPVYALNDDWQIIQSEAPREIENLGKIYLKDQFVFLVDLTKGVHVIDNTDPSNPIALYFFSIPGCTDISIKNNILYANNYRDLVAINISDFNDLKITERISDFYQQGAFLYPPNYSGYFECVDESQGAVLGWELNELINPKCNIF